MSEQKILVIGCNGQIGTVLTRALSKKYEFNNVIGSDISKPKESVDFIFEVCSVLDGNQLLSIIKQHNITDVYFISCVFIC